MARRNDIDWEAIEREYMTGMTTIAAIAAKHSVSSSQIKVKAKANAWQRDLSGAIKARTRAKISAIDISAIVEQSATQSASKSAKLIKEAIEHASDVAAGVALRHRADLKLMVERGQSLDALFDQHISGAENLGDVFKAAQTFKAIVDARSKLIDKEREAFGITDSSQDSADTSPVEIQVNLVAPSGGN